MNDLKHSLVATWKGSVHHVNSNYLPPNRILEGYAHDKKLLRQHSLQLRKKTFKDAPTSINAEISKGLAAQSLKVLERLSSPTVCAYTPRSEEPGNFEWLNILSKNCERLFLPLSKPDGHLAWGEYQGRSTMVPGPYNIPEPATVTPHIFSTPPGVDVIFMPATAVDKNGGRVGHGAGFYDRTLAHIKNIEKNQQLPTFPLLVGVVYDHEVVDNIPLEEHDERINMIVTPTQMYFCTTSGA